MKIYYKFSSCKSSPIRTIVNLNIICPSKREIKHYFNEQPNKLLAKLVIVFLQNNLFIFQKRDTKNTKTNHYILLTNVSIKSCITKYKPCSSSGKSLLVVIVVFAPREARAELG